MVFSLAAILSFLFFAQGMSERSEAAAKPIASAGLRKAEIPASAVKDAGAM